MPKKFIFVYSIQIINRKMNIKFLQKSIHFPMNIAPTSTISKQKSSVPLFIAKVYEILQKQEHSEFIQWTENGNSFYIKDIKLFQENILPVYFRHKNFASFVRQLNMYDFHKIRGEQKHIFEHKLFKKSAKHLLIEIKRKCLKKSKQENQDDNISEQKEEVKQITEEKQSQLLENMNMNAYLNMEYEITLKNFELNSKKLIQMRNEYEQKNKKDKKLMDEVIIYLKNYGPKSDRQIKQKINQLKKNPKFELLNRKNYIYQIYKKVKQNLYSQMIRNTLEDLEELSIQEEILYNQIQKPKSRAKILSLANFDTEKFLQRSCEIIKGQNGTKDFI